MNGQLWSMNICVSKPSRFNPFPITFEILQQIIQHQMSLQDGDNNQIKERIPLQEQLMEVDKFSASSKGTPKNFVLKPHDAGIVVKKQIKLAKKESNAKSSHDTIQFRSHQGSIDQQAEQKHHKKNLPSDADLMKLKTIDIVEKDSSNEDNNCFHSSGPESDDDDDKMSYRQINIEIPLQDRVNTQMACLTGSQHSIQESKPQQIIAKFDNKQQSLKNYEKRSKELERFQIHMCLSQSYEKTNPLLSLYKSMNPKILEQSTQKVLMKYPQVFIQKPLQSDYQQFNLNNPLCINGINTMSPPKDQSKKRQQRKLELTAERNQEKIGSYLKEGYKQAKAAESKRNKSAQKTPSMQRKPQQQQLDYSMNNGNAVPQESIEQQFSGQKKIKVFKIKQKKLVINVSMCRYPIIRKIAKYEFGHFLSN